MQARTKPQFQKEPRGGFYQELKASVKTLIEEQQTKAATVSWTKVVVYPGLYLTFYLILLLLGKNLFLFYIAYAVMGALVTFIVFNIVHDAVHHALFKNESHNRKASMILDFLGGNSFVWRKRHVLYHHTFTNVPGWDIDIQQTSILRFNTKQSYLSIYRYQHIYMPVLYLFYSLNWVLHRDFKDFFSSSSLIRKNTEIPAREYQKLLFFKSLYLSFILVAPVLLHQHRWYHYTIGFVLMHWITSALTLLVLLPSHLDEAANFPEPGEDLKLENTWAIHQLKVTNDFGTNQPILNFLMGGLNHHIAHHLFPTVNHNIIPGITAHIVKAAAANGLPYKCYGLRAIMVSHFKLLKQNSVRKQFFEE